MGVDELEEVIGALLLENGLMKIKLWDLEEDKVLLMSRRIISKNTCEIFITQIYIIVNK